MYDKRLFIQLHGAMPTPPVVGIDYKDKDVGHAIVFGCTGKE
jgi:hypothetical protein